MKIIILHTFLYVMVIANDPITDTPLTLAKSLKSAHISPEIINELKDFENLIPTATLDAIVAEHYLVDGNFRTALKYLRSNEFTQLQSKLLTMPEIIQVLEFLHLTTVNATATMHMGAAVTLDDYNDNRIGKMTTNMATKAATTSNPIIVTRTEEATAKRLHKRPHKSNNDVDVHSEHAHAINEERQPLVRIVLLENSKVKTKAYDVVAISVDAHNDKYISSTSPPHSTPHHQHSLGTFTSFVEEVLTHLPNSEYQNMIKDKCSKNANFAKFYKALRSPEFKPIVDEVMKTPNILNVIKTLSSHDLDVKSLEPIAFQVISWGP